MSERKQAKSYTAEFKESAVKLAVESKRPLTQTFGISTVSQIQLSAIFGDSKAI
jgi:transposase-like protein